MHRFEWLCSLDSAHKEFLYNMYSSIWGYSRVLEQQLTLLYEYSMSNFFPYCYRRTDFMYSKKKEKKKTVQYRITLMHK